ncbi:MAG: hypothetical protein AABN95_14665 [Acidobacteriota bacterium]
MANNSQRGPKPQLGSPSQAPTFLHSGIFEKNPKALAAWLSFIKDGTYRAAHAEDFQFSQAAKNELQGMFGEMWYPRINHPAITGNISRQDWFYDLAVIVVDTKRTDARRFGLVVFNVPKEGKAPPDPHWLLRERDLSSALLSWHSNWPVLVFYGADGSADPYYINWEKRRQRYFLDKEQRGPDARGNTRLRDRDRQ